MKFNFIWKLLVAAILSQITAVAQQYLQDQVINIQFAGSGSSLKTGTAATGANSTDYWNLHNRDTQLLETPNNRLLWANQQASPASIVVNNAAGLWGNGHPDPMFGAYVYPSNTGDISVAITNLPPGVYRVLVYAHGGPPDEQNSKVYLQSGTNDFGWRRTATTSAWRSTEWLEGNQYVAFTNVSVSANNGISIQCRPDGASQSFLNGIQLVREQSPAPPNLINVQFTQITAPNRVGFAAIGNSASDFWNKYIRDDPSGGYRSFGTLSNLFWSTGEATSASLSIANAPGAWGNGFPDSMFGAYLYPLGGGNIDVNLTSLPTGTYDVLVYAHGGPPDAQNSIIEVSSLGDSYGTKATSAGPDWSLLAWENGRQYVLFTNVAVTSLNTLNIVSRPGQANVAVINGLQLLRRSSTVDLTPRFSIVPSGTGIFTNSTSASIEGFLYGNIVRFTTDGTDPTPSSRQFIAPIPITTNVTVRAQAFQNNVAIGNIVSQSFRRAYIFNDGITTQWRTQYFGVEYWLDTNSFASADPDGDGSTNAQEFLNNTDPTDPNSGFRINLTLVPRIGWRSTIGTVYQVLRKDSPTDRDWSIVREFSATNSESVFIDSEVTNPHGFYSVRPRP